MHLMARTQLKNIIPSDIHASVSIGKQSPCKLFTSDMYTNYSMHTIRNKKTTRKKVSSNDASDEKTSAQVFKWFLK